MSAGADPKEQAEPVATASRPGHDAPIEESEADRLGRWGFARAIDRVIHSAPQGWSTRIGLYGEWGGGKTSVLNMLRTMVEARQDVVVELSLWNATGENGFFDAFVEALEPLIPKAATTRKGWFKRKVKAVGAHADTTGVVSKEVGKVLGSLPGFGVPGVAFQSVGVALSMGSDALKKWVKPSAADLIRMQESLGTRRVVVFIDDLDRADPHSIPKALLGLRELLDWPNFAFVLAFDRRVVARALEQYSQAYGEAADAFLEKIVDVPMTLPMPDEEAIAVMAGDALRTLCPFLPSGVVDAWARLFPRNPRRVKQVVRALAALSDVAARHDPDELNWHGMVGQTLLQQLAPDVAHVTETTLLGAERNEAWASEVELREERERGVRAALDADRQARSLDPVAAGQRRDWLSLIVERTVSARRVDEQKKIRYEMSLLRDEPPFTHKEGRQLVKRVADGVRQLDLDREVEAGAHRSGRSARDSADDLLATILAQLLQRCSVLVRSRDDDEVQAALRDYLPAFALVETLCSSTVPSIRDAAANQSHCLSVLHNALNLAGYRNEGFGPHAASAIALAQRAATQCCDTWGLYFSDILSNDRGRNIAVARVVTQVKAALSPAILRRVLSELSKPGGVVSLLSRGSEDDQSGLWALTSPSSPIYGEGKPGLLELLGSGGTGSDVGLTVVARNAADFLEVVGMISVRQSFRGDLATYCAEHGDVVVAAWRAALRARPGFLRDHELPALRTQLMREGFPGDLLPAPDWLVQPAQDVQEDEAPREPRGE